MRSRPPHICADLAQQGDVGRVDAGPLGCLGSWRCEAIGIQRRQHGLDLPVAFGDLLLVGSEPHSGHCTAVAQIAEMVRPRALHRRANIALRAQAKPRIAPPRCQVTEEFRFIRARPRQGHSERRHLDSVAAIANARQLDRHPRSGHEKARSPNGDRAFQG